MEPLPKLVSYIALACTTLIAFLTVVVPVLPPKYAVIAVTALGALKAISHSINGAGGKHNVPDEMGFTKNITGT